MTTHQPERPTCATCPYWESVASVDPAEVLTAGELVVYELRNGVGKYDSSYNVQETAHILKATVDKVRKIEREANAKLFLASSGGACHRHPETLDKFKADWCGEHPDFPAWIKSQRRGGRVNPHQVIEEGIALMIKQGVVGLRKWRKLTGLTTPQVAKMSCDEFERRDPELYASIVGDSPRDDSQTLHKLLRIADKFGFGDHA